jgi:hypothetical protein
MMGLLPETVFPLSITDELQVFPKKKLKFFGFHPHQ